MPYETMVGAKNDIFRSYLLYYTKTMRREGGLVCGAFARNVHVKIKISELTSLISKLLTRWYCAQNRTRTCTPRSTRTWNERVYHSATWAFAVAKLRTLFFMCNSFGRIFLWGGCFFRIFLNFVVAMGQNLIIAYGGCLSVFWLTSLHFGGVCCGGIGVGNTYRAGDTVAQWQADKIAPLGGCRLMIYT